MSRTIISTLRFALITVGLIAAAAIAAVAHPLGNFSINQFTRIETEEAHIKVKQVADFAEIPTFQEMARIDTDRDGQMSTAELSAYQAELTPQYLANLRLTIGDEAATLAVTASTARLVEGEGGLPTLRMEWDLSAPLGAAAAGTSISFENNNYDGRNGWREIVVQEGGGVSVYNSTAFANTVSDELRSYPADLLSSPLTETKAAFSVTRGEIPAGADSLKGRDGKPAEPVVTDRLAKLISVPEITPMVALFGLLLAFGLGAVHAMSPGHGKTVVGAYLVGSRGTAKHALFLGLTVTITHTLGVFALGLITLFASNYFLPERIMPFLGFVSGLLVFFIGVSLLKERLYAFFGWKKGGHHHHEAHDHGDGHTHSHDHGDGHAHSHDHEPIAGADGSITHSHGGSAHTHAPPEAITWKSLLALGVSGGLLPCPSALVLMLAAIAANRVGYGLILTIAFSFGLAATLAAVGLIFLNVRNFFGRTSLAQNRVFQFLPVASAFIVAFVGAVICYNSIA